MKTVFTFPGKCGDALHQWPVAYWWARENGKQFTCWMDEPSTKMLKPLFEAQPCVEAVEFKPGIEHYNCGGQPWHFNLETKDFEGLEIHHLGFRGQPQRQLTMDCWAWAKVRITASQDVVANTPSLEVGAGERVNRLVLHGQAVYTHTRSTPGFWPFLNRVRGELAEMFDEVVWVGSPRDREVGRRTYPEWGEFADDGDFLKLGRFMAESRAVIGVGSSVVALAGALKVPCVRVHDPIGEMPKQIWDNLGDNQANLTEIELRSAWPEWRDRWLKSEVPVG